MRNFRKMILLLAVLLCMVGRGIAATALGSITISGAEQSSGSTWDTGTVTATINGVSVNFGYGQFTTPAAIASALGALISQKCGSQVYAKANGATLTLYQKGSNTITSASITSVSNNPSLFPSNSFEVNSGGTWSIPLVTGLSLPEGPSGMGFVITGTGFAANAQVTIGGMPATIIGTPTSTQIVVQVPDGVTLGNVVVIMNGWLSPPWPFTVDPPFQCN
jgi:hypothetical protein